MSALRSALLYPYEEIIQSAKLTETEQAEACPEAHDSFGIGADTEGMLDF